MSRQILACALLIGLWATQSGFARTAGDGREAEEPGAAEPASPPTMEATGEEAVPSPAAELVSSIEQPPLRLLLEDVLQRNPEIARARARARAIERRPVQAGTLPDPMASVTAFVLTPETRVGPQELSAGISQKLPWFGKLGLREQAELYRAATARADVEAISLKQVTEVRRLYYELGFIDALDRIVGVDRATLSHYEELARSRYASGIGLQQAVVKIQAEITRADSRLLQIADRRAATVAAINALRDMPQGTEIGPAELPRFAKASVEVEGLEKRATELRPEIAAADAEIARTSTTIDLAEKDYRPDFTLGMSYTLVGRRDDPAGRAMPPPDNGDDILGVSAMVNLPIWRKKLAAGVEEAVWSESAAREAKRQLITQIDRGLGELTQRIDLTWKQLRLFEDVLVVQAEQSLSSAEAGYSAGSQGALDLLDAERVLLEVRTGTERNRADYAIAMAQLEGVVGEPLATASTEGAE